MTTIETGRYICTRTSSRIMGPLIRWSTHSAYDHAFIAGPDGSIIQATMDGVRRGKLTEYAGQPACVNTGEFMTDVQRAKVWAAAEAMVGAPYDYPDLLALAAADLGWHWNLAFRLMGKPPWRICSQLVAMAGQAAGLNWFCTDKYADQVTPAALARRPGMVPVTW